MSRPSRQDETGPTSTWRRSLWTLSAAADRASQWLVPESLRDTPERLQQANRVLAFCFAMWGWVPLFAAIYVLLEGWPCAWLLIVAGVLLTAIPLVQRATRRPTLAGNLLILLGASTYTGLACLTGGRFAPTVGWFVSVPIAGVLLVGKRWGLFWTVVSTLIVCAFFGASELGYVCPIIVSERGLLLLHALGQIGILACIFALAVAFWTVEQNHQRALERALHLATGADRAKSEFLANMSHEIRTPMTAILGFTELLLEGGSAKSLGDDSRDALHTIQRNGQHLLGLINDILDLSKIESGKLELEARWASPRQMVDEVIELMRVRAEAKSLRIDARFEGALPAEIETDPTRLRQVLINLLGNAIKFTESGAVSLRTRWRVADAGGALEFEIVDTGIGMSVEQIDRLFQPFSQADMSMTRRFGGTGLGLSISKRLTEMLGGTIDVRSRLGEGSTFTVRLPVSQYRCIADGHNPDMSPVDPAVVAGGGDISHGTLNRRAELTDDSQSRLSFRETSATFAERKATIARLTPAHGDFNTTALAETQSPGPLTGCRVLLAEDCADNQRLLGHLLRRAGAELVIAADGGRAVAAAHEARDHGQAFDVILMDMQMPVLSGCEATRQLRREGYQGPIIALTALSAVGDHRDCRAAGCDDVATKPIDRAALIAAIQRQLALSIAVR